MKKLLAFVLALALLLGLLACGKANGPVPNTTQPDAETGAAAPRPEDKPSRMSYYSADGNLHSSIIYEYDEKGEVLRDERRDADGNIVVRKMKNTYDERERLIQVERYSSDGSLLHWSSHEYNDNSQLIRTRYDSSISTDIGGTVTYTYNEQGQLIQSEDCADFSSILTSIYEYDMQRLMIRENVYNYYGEEEKEKLAFYKIYDY